MLGEGGLRGKKARRAGTFTLLPPRGVNKKLKVLRNAVQRLAMGDP